MFASGAGTLAIHDSTLRDNSAQGSQGANGTAPGKNGAAGGSADGGGLYVAGSGWTVTLTGDTLSGNAAIGGNGGNGGNGGDAKGGAAYFSVNGSGGSLTILNDLGAPRAYPSTMIDNTVQGGVGGVGGVGGSVGGGGDASGGALFVGGDGTSVNANIGNRVSLSILD